MRSTGTRSPGAHPRTGGDHVTLSPRGTLGLGSPPHGRGPQHDRRAADVGAGLTPARAGTTFVAFEKAAGKTGSPPHGAGTTSTTKPSAHG